MWIRIAADRRNSVCGHRVSTGSSRKKASDNNVAPDGNWEFGDRRPFRRGSEGWRPSCSQSRERSQRWKLG
ncbi:hypothetical protein DPMN_167201 [Dreissena polymorpha]|uniref:Uncharacterized protein n=1 Tax=Dreissena polymorpha TaxID=45954 RepID=A0A9D4IY42_DREPO|nr:hypothetical protein DPMN_167201 [Dreissena polymorpha]